jgi:hypothetical protein
VRRNRFLLTGLYQLPFGRGRRFGSNSSRPVDAIFCSRVPPAPGGRYPRSVDCYKHYLSKSAILINFAYLCAGLRLSSSYPHPGLTQFSPQSTLNPVSHVFGKGGAILEGKIEIGSNLWTRVVEVAQARGFSSPQQFVMQLIERELAKDEISSSDAEITQKMEELGYLDFGRDI